MGFFADRGRQQNANPVGSLHNVKIGDDVAIRVNDDTGTETPLAADRTGCAFLVFFAGTIAGHENFHDGR